MEGESHWTTGYIALPILEPCKRRVLLVLDNLKVLLEEGKVLDGCDLTWQRAVNCCTR